MKGTRFFSTAAGILALLFLVGSTACSSPVLGEWQSEQKLSNGERNELWFYKDKSGEATLWATPVGQLDNWQVFDFETDWTEFSGSVFDIEMSCDSSNCDGNNDDFVLECDGVDQGGGDLKLDCTGDGKWGQYVFNWEKVN